MGQNRSILLSKIRSRVFYGWWVVLACISLNIYLGGTFHYGFGNFVHPIVNEMGWSMAVISGAFSLYRLEAGVAAPLAGFLLDRINPSKLVMAGAILVGSGYIFMSQVKTVLLFYIALFINSTGFSFSAGSAIGAPLIGKWFVRKKGKALGLYTAGNAVGGLLVPVLAHLITVYGWRLTLLIMGPVTWFIALPLSLILRSKPEEYGLLPDGDSSVRTPDTLDVPNTTGVTEVNFSIQNAILTPVFWLITLCFIVFQMTMSAIFVHLIPYLITVGIEARLAALAVTFLTLISIFGRVGFGWLGDFFSKKWLLIMVFLLQVAGISALTQVRADVYIVPFLLAYAPSYGGLIALRPAILVEYYGRKNFGTIYGLIHGISMFGGITGPIIAGLVYDIQGNYYLAFVFFAFLNLVAAVALLFLRSPSQRKERLSDASKNECCTI